MTEPQPFERMPLVYERAFGGCPPSQRGRARPDLDERNPIGTPQGVGGVLVVDDPRGEPGDRIMWALDNRTAYEAERGWYVDKNGGTHWIVVALAFAGSDGGLRGAAVLALPTS